MEKRELYRGDREHGCGEMDVREREREREQGRGREGEA